MTFQVPERRRLKTLMKWGMWLDIDMTRFEAHFWFVECDCWNLHQIQNAKTFAQTDRISIMMQSYSAFFLASASYKLSFDYYNFIISRTKASTWEMKTNVFVKRVRELYYYYQKTAYTTRYRPKFEIELRHTISHVIGLWFIWASKIETNDSNNF